MLSIYVAFKNLDFLFFQGLLRLRKGQQLCFGSHPVNLTSHSDARFDPYNFNYPFNYHH